jgi:hypothetical protein
MGRAGSDLALDSADAVIVRDELATIPAVIALSRHARRLVLANLVIAATFITALVVWDLAGYRPLPLGVLGHEGSTVIVGLNGLRLLRTASGAAARPEVAVAHSSPSPDRSTIMVSGAIEPRVGTGGRCGDRLIRWTTTVSVVVLAVIAAIISYRHMFVLVHRYGESSWTAALLPVSVDGMIVASSMSLLASSRQGQRSGVLPWVLLVLGSVASLSANVAVAEPSAVGRLIAAWPSCALIGAYELLMRQIRQAAARRGADGQAASCEASIAPVLNAVSHESSDERYTGLRGEAAASPNGHTIDTKSPRRSYDTQSEHVEQPRRDTYEKIPHFDPESGGSARTRGRQSASVRQRQAWQWAMVNRAPNGDLPSGKAIAERFGRRERWGRLVKRAGASGCLDPVATDVGASRETKDEALIVSVLLNDQTLQPSDSAERDDLIASRED